MFRAVEIFDDRPPVRIVARRATRVPTANLAVRRLCCVRTFTHRDRCQRAADAARVEPRTTNLLTRGDMRVLATSSLFAKETDHGLLRL